MPRVKTEPPKTIREALERADEYIAGELVKVMKDLVGISHSGEDERARVSAASKIVDYARPPKQGAMVNVHTQVAVASHLNLPQGRGKQRNPKGHELIEVEKAKHRKILPEPNPIHRTSFRGNFSAANPQQPGSPVAAEPTALVPRSKTPHKPDAPPAASTIRPLE